MGVASLDGKPFRIDPYSVSWDYTIKAVDQKTVGGKVVQVVGATLGDMRVTGAFGVGGWEEQSEFLTRMKALGDRQAGGRSEPVRFSYPTKGWNFLVYLKAYTDPESDNSVHLSAATYSPKWQLTLFIVEDNSGLDKVAVDHFIARLSAGLGWKQTAYNGPMDYAEVEDFLRQSENGLIGYLVKQYGFSAAMQSGMTPPTPPWNTDVLAPAAGATAGQTAAPSQSGNVNISPGGNQQS